MDRTKSLIKNTFIFALGSLGSKLLQFLLLPFYTRILSNADYGTIDLLQAAVTIIIPIASLTVSEAVFRYAMDKSCDNRDVFSIGLFITIIGTILLCIIGAIVQLFLPIEYAWFVIITVCTTALRNVFSQFTRAIGNVKIFTTDNILQTGLILVFNILFLAVFHMGINGYLIGYIMGNVGSTLFLLCASKLWRFITFTRIQTGVMEIMLFFCIPLIPNAISWWISSFSDRLMVTYFWGAGVNGLYAVAYKIPSVLTVVVGIFFQAWQISANEEFGNRDFVKFYSSIFESLQVFTFLLSSVLIILCKLITRIMVSSNFYNSWKYMPTLLLAMAFFSLAQFLGSIYTANKKTVMALITNVTAAVINIVLNWFFIQWFGAIGAAITTMISYLVLWLFRAVDTNKIVKINYNYFSLISNIILLSAQAVLVSISLQYWELYASACLLIMLIINRNALQMLFNIAKGILLRLFPKKVKADV